MPTWVYEGWLACSVLVAVCVGFIDSNDRNLTESWFMRIIMTLGGPITIVLWLIFKIPYLIGDIVEGIFDAFT